MAKKDKGENNSPSPVSADDEQKKRKKQAKREAKMMLEIQEANSSIQKAENKLAKAQASLNARNAHLRTLEADLSEFRTSHEQTEDSVLDAGFDHQLGQPELEEKTETSVQNNNPVQDASTNGVEPIPPIANVDNHIEQPELEEISTNSHQQDSSSLN